MPALDDRHSDGPAAGPRPLRRRSRVLAPGVAAVLLLSLAACLPGGRDTSRPGAGPSGASGPGASAPAEPVRSVTFRASDAVQADPERGPVVFHQPVAGAAAANREPLDTPGVLEYFARERERTGATLVRVVYTLQEWREAPLPAAFLARVDRDFAVARSNGYKLIPYFAYNWVPEKDRAKGRDAGADRIVVHLDQLRPVLHRNADVLALMIAGFIGSWGEWHSSTSGNRAPDESVNEATRRILEALLAAVPQQRAVALRYPQDKADLYGTGPMTPAQAFDGSARSRLGFHDESFLNNRWLGERQQVWYYPYIAREGLYVPQVVAHDPDTLTPGSTLSCRTVLEEVARLHVDVMLDVEGAEKVTGSCAPELRRRLGYRFRLTRAAAPQRVLPGFPLGLTFTVVNDGVAPPYNERPVDVVLRHRDTGATTVVPTGADPRRWLPGSTTTVAVDARVPAGLAPGVYDVLLHLPDAAARLRANPAYAVRLANKEVFEERTGYNDLHLDVTVG